MGKRLMSGGDRSLIRPFAQQDYWLLATGAGLVIIHLTLTSRANDDSLFGNSFL
ncbi:MAG: hypothetical protein F6J97_26675, partial [Leptolyngbya sp. SIO4C1]|nr:hypothetical protein [Leptolyngbya sp. SIO4C1]